jgi:hypothetical protein
MFSKRVKRFDQSQKNSMAGTNPAIADFDAVRKRRALGCAPHPLALVALVRIARLSRAPRF